MMNLIKKGNWRDRHKHVVNPNNIPQTAAFEVACYLYPGPLGHKPAKLHSAVTNPTKPRKPELQ